MARATDSLKNNLNSITANTTSPYRLDGEN